MKEPETIHVRFTESRNAFKIWLDEHEGRFKMEVDAQEWLNLKDEVERLRSLLRATHQYSEETICNTDITDQSSHVSGIREGK